MVCFRIARAADWDDGGDARGTGRWRAATGDGGVSRDGDGRCGGGHRDVPRDPGTAGDGQRSVYLPIMKQGGDTNTIEVVNGIRRLIGRLYDVPATPAANVVFDQSAFVKEAIRTLLDEGLIGLLLTSVMILVFLGSLRATSAVFLSIPLSALATFVVLSLAGSTVNTMILGGLALAFSRVIDNSVISLENI